MIAMACGRTRPEPAGPSVLLVTIDTLRADHVGAYGASFAETPTLDALAREGVRVDTAIAPTPLTLPSHASLLTGLLPPGHGVRHNGVYRLGTEMPTLAERFRDAGWETAAIVGSVVLSRRHGLDRGFELYDDQMPVDRHASATGYPERPAREVTERALRFLDATQRPFFLWLHYYDVHAAYQPPEPFASRFRDRPYDGEIAAVDAALGRVIARLREQGRLDRTLVVVTADHGESLGEHGERTHGYGLYDATLRVPLVLRGPGVPAARVLSGVTSLVAIAPTLLSAAGLPAFPASDGADLAPRFHAAGDGPSGSAAYAESLATRIDHGWSPLFAWRTETHHYVRAPRSELYALANDPGQRVDLLAHPAASDEPGAASPERGPAGAPELAVAVDRAEQGIAKVVEHAAAAPAFALDASERAQLEALGYALPATPRGENGLDPKDGLRFLDAFAEAKAALHRGELARARSLATPLEAPLAGSPELHELLAQLAFAEGRVDRARVHAERALAGAPENPRAALLLGDAAFELGDAEAALAAWRRADELDPGLPGAKAGLALAPASAGDAATAEAWIEQARALAPEDAALEERIAAIFDRAGDAARARDAAERAIRLDPGRPAAHLLLAIQLARLGEPDAADRARAAAGVVDAPALESRLAIAYAATGETARAEALLRALLARHPDLVSARKNLALLLRRVGRVAEAAELERGAPPQG